ncbi:hypothetical protein [Streptomyces arenae]|uniref:hypothetical protein n=1 Tax=Streptomyces arenae TaxID=29301 RepID=UPI0026588C19|nr:hypothetical protein [Streptomyces arenae]MCG7202296.1 hypothetical protein [Streptomyces arenae]
MTSSSGLPGRGLGAALTPGVAVIAPLAGSRHAHALHDRDLTPVAVDPVTAATPPSHRGAAADDGYAHVITYDGDLRRTLKKLRAVGVGTVLAASPAGVELAERIAWHLHLPGTGVPGSASLRTDPGVQAKALARAGITTPHTLRTSRLPEAISWADCVPARAYRLMPAAFGTGAEVAHCHSSDQITRAWPRIQHAALRHTGTTALVLQELVQGHEYMVDSITHPGPGGPQHTITSIWTHQPPAAPGRPQRHDLLHRRNLLARRLSIEVCRALDALGVEDGTITSHLVFAPDQGPLLLSARVNTHRSHADETVWKITGMDPLDAALEYTRPDSGSPGPRITRIRLQVPRPPGLSTVPVGRLQALPTVKCLDTRPSPDPFTTRSTRPSYEIVLSHDSRDAVEHDYHRITALTALDHVSRHLPDR